MYKIFITAILAFVTLFSVELSAKEVYAGYMDLAEADSGITTLNISSGYTETQGIKLDSGRFINLSGGELHVLESIDDNLILEKGSHIKISGHGLFVWHGANKLASISRLIDDGSIIWNSDSLNKPFEIWHRTWKNASGESLYAYIDNEEIYIWTGKTNSQGEISALRHRYSFDFDASDGVGSADLKLQGRARVSDGNLLLAGGAYNAGYAYAEGSSITEIASTINAAKGITFEAWVIIEATDWTRLFGVGADNKNNIELIVRPNKSGHRPPTGNLICPDVNGAQIESSHGVIPNGVMCYLALVYDDTRNMMSIHMAREGEEVVTTRNYPRHFPTHVSDLTPVFADLKIDKFRLGSNFTDTKRDDIKGSIDEFRIWATALTDEQIAVNAAAGPDVIGTTFGKIAIDVTKPAYPIYFKKFGSYSFIDNSGNAVQRLVRQGEYRSTAFFSWIREGREGFKDKADNWLGNAPYETENPKGLLFKASDSVGVNYDLNWAEARKNIYDAGLIDYVQWSGFPYFGTKDLADDLYEHDPLHGPITRNGIPNQTDRGKLANDMARLAAKNSKYDLLLTGKFRPSIWSLFQEPEHNFGDPDLAWNSTEPENITDANKMYNARLLVRETYTEFTKNLHNLEPDIRVSGLQQNATVSSNQGMNQVTRYGAVGGTAYGVVTKEWIAKELINNTEYPLDYLSCNSYKGYEFATYVENSRFALKNLIHELYPSNPEKFNRFNRTYFFLSHYNYSNFSDSGTDNFADMYYNSDKGDFGALMENLCELIRTPDLSYAFLGVHFGGNYGDENRRYDRFLKAYNALPETSVKLETGIGVDGLAAYDDSIGFCAILSNRTDHNVWAPIELKGREFNKAIFWVLRTSPSDSKSSEWVQLNEVEMVGQNMWNIPFTANDIIFMAAANKAFPSEFDISKGPEGLLWPIESGIQRAQFAASDAYIPRINAMEISEWNGHLAPPEPASCAYFDQQKGRMEMGLRDPGVTACAAVVLCFVPESGYSLKAKLSGIGLPANLPASATFRIRIDYLDHNNVLASHEIKDAGSTGLATFDDIEWLPGAESVSQTTLNMWSNRKFALPIGDRQPANWATADEGKRRIRISVLLSGLENAASLMIDFDDTIVE